MMVSFILQLLPVLLATTSAQDALTCKVCSGSVDICRAASQTCMVPKATGGCITVAEENTLDGTETVGFSKGCIDDYNSDIKVPTTFTFGNGKYLRINTARCNTDKCNLGIIEVPKKNMTLNGQQCPTCFALNSDSCNSQITPCTGDEIHCIDMTGQVLKGSAQFVATFVAKGCTNASARDIKAGTTLNSAVYSYVFAKETFKHVNKRAIDPTAAASAQTTAPPKTDTTNTEPPKTDASTQSAATTKSTDATTNGGSPALGQFSFALCLPGLTGLLLMKLLS